MSSSQINVLTFNMLAPCYKRMYSEDKQPIGREQRFNQLWTKRLDRILDLLLHITPTPHVIALQEFWFNPDFQHRFESAMASHFHIFYHQRPASKEDGLATLIRRNAPVFTAQTPHPHTFPLPFQRVALALSVPLASDTPDPQEYLLIVNAHLTFPHSDIHESIRPAQAQALTNFVNTHVRNAPHPTHALVLGDFNGDDTSTVCRHMCADGFENCYTKLHGPAHRPTTHFNHRKQEVFVDHIFLRTTPPQTPPVRHNRRTPSRPRSSSSSPVGIRDMRPNSTPRDADKPHLPPSDPGHTPMPCNMQPVSMVVYPESLPTNGWPHNFHISDHRPVGISFRRTLQQPQI